MVLIDGSLEMELGDRTLEPLNCIIVVVIEVKMR